MLEHRLIKNITAVGLDCETPLGSAMAASTKTKESATPLATLRHHSRRLFQSAVNREQAPATTDKQKIAKCF